MTANADKRNSLRSLRQLRERAVRQQAQQTHDAAFQLQRWESKLESLNQQGSELNSRLAEVKQNGRIDLRTICDLERYLDGVEQSRLQMTQRREAAASLLTEEQCKLMEARQELRKIELLQERQQKKAALAESKIQQRVQDEWSCTRVAGNTTRPRP